MAKKKKILILSLGFHQKSPFNDICHKQIVLLTFGTNSIVFISEKQLSGSRKDRPWSLSLIQTDTILTVSTELLSHFPWYNEGHSPAAIMETQTVSWEKEARGITGKVALPDKHLFSARGDRDRWCFTPAIYQAYGGTDASWVQGQQDSQRWGRAPKVQKDDPVSTVLSLFFTRAHLFTTVEERNGRGRNF